MIRIRGLAVRLSSRDILQGVDLDVARGESVALVGANGAGKTTLLRCLLGLVRHTGSISVGGIDLARDAVGVKRQLGYMPQVPAFCEESARAALTFVAKLRGASVDEIPALLERVGLSAHAHRPVRAFSAGMKQRLSLAAALLGDPPVLVLDEPTASLDVEGQTELVRLLGELVRGGRTLLLSSHRAEEIAALARRVVVLHEGRVKESRTIGSTYEGEPVLAPVSRLRRVAGGAA
ncbi:MAG: ABC transporter ATP-binding protein [Planctomycetes bacterium]|nr:ABC transporter ATP-binding protein [Planctomycetota bacterium]